MNGSTTIYCPNCGNYAERSNCPETDVIRTSCYHCDYLMIQCSRTGAVIEAYAPGIESKIELSLAKSSP